MIRILHTSDWHLGRVLHERSLLEDQRHALSCLHEIIRTEPHDALIISGDIYDRSIPPAEAVDLLSRFLVELRKFSAIPVIMIPGNHDSGSRLSYCSEILALSDIHIFSDYKKIGTPLTIEGEKFRADFYPVPFLEPSSFEEHENNESAGPRATHEAALIKAAEEIKKRMDKDSINIFIGHLFTWGGFTSDSERRFIGTAGSVDPAILKIFDYAALGHLHRPQRISEKAYYSGSLLKYSFSECGDSKQALSVTVDKKKAKVEPFAIEPLRNLIRLKSSFHELLNSREFIQYRNFYIEAELTDAGLVTNPAAILRERFPYLMSVKQTTPAIEVPGNMQRLSTPEADIGNEFSSFHEYLYDSAPEKEKIMLFTEICAREIKA